MSNLRRKLMKLLASIERVISSLISGVPPLSLPDAIDSDVKSLIAYGGIEQNGTPTPSSPVNIVCNNGVLKFDSVNQEIYADGTVETVGIGDLFDSVDGQGTFVVPSSSNTTRIHKAFGQLPNGKYKVSITGNFEFIFQYKNAITGYTQYGNIDTWTTGGVYDLDKTGYYYGIAIRYPNNRTIRPSNFNGTITIIPVGNSATVEMLLKVDDYQDTQEVISGAVTRNVGVKVLDGTENWLISNNLFYTAIATDALEDTHICYCTHFKGVATNASASYNNEIKVGTNVTQTVHWTRVQIYPIVGTYSNVTAFKQWLADQYAAGTPVIVVYPLNTPTTEYVGWQQIRTIEGDNVVDITQASMSELELSVEYYKIPS